MTTSIVKFDFTKAGSSKQGRIKDLPFADLIEPNTAFMVPIGSQSGTSAALKRYIAQHLGDSATEAELKAYGDCYRVVMAADPADETGAEKPWVGLAKYLPDYPASVVMEMVAEREAEAAMLDMVNRRGTIAGLRKGIAAAETKINELEKSSEKDAA